MQRQEQEQDRQHKQIKYTFNTTQNVTFFIHVKEDMERSKMISLNG